MCYAELIAEHMRHHRSASESALKTIADAASKFHELSGTSACIADQLTALRHGAPIIRFAHQPNLFSYLGILGQFFFVHHLSRLVFNATGQPVVPAYFIVDYDTAGDRRFHSSLLPDPGTRHGTAKISYALGRRYEKRVAYSLTAPDEGVSREWSTLFEQWAGRYTWASGAATSPFIPPTEIGLEAARDSVARLAAEYQRNRLFSSGNAAHLSHLVNSVWRLPIVFVPLSVSAAGLEEEMLGLAEQLGAQGVHDTTYAWYVCPRCHTRTDITAPIAQKLLRCTACGQFAERRASGGNPARARIVPKVVMDNLADYALYGAVGGTGYVAGLEHVRSSHRAAKRIGLRAGPELSVRFLYQGDVELPDTPPLDSASRAFALVRSGRASLLYYLAILGYEGLRRGLDNSFFQNKCAAHRKREDSYVE
ncbi:hypothetical protein [Streptomyces europaeiscabiei]|uniref:hypothetical protein n=1 Tax=Streptomyces europaeiscabiei TaxID=146819 RepID=UPI0029BE22F5|nr:hypothetical protein [Streptomyces europaeiscabiei]MDX2759256.1 hypothetical protein [Streptomyces europaeiscabiei]